MSSKQVRQQAILALADGRYFEGHAVGAVATADDPVVGEAVFNTSMFGYQEILTDPSYAGQIMCFTTPHIGNVGCNPDDVESEKIQTAGVLFRDLSLRVSNYRGTVSLDDYLRQAGVMGMYGFDTRELVIHLREHGAQMSALAVGDSSNLDTLVDHAKAAGSMEGKDYVQHVTCHEPYSWTELPWSLKAGKFPTIKSNDLWSRPHVVAIDCGVKRNILRLLLDSGFRVTVVPATFSTNKILELNPDAVFVSNGPGDPATLGYVVSTVTDLLGRLPIFGICLGHQIIAQAVGMETYKLKFGHRGGNHPVLDTVSDRIRITVQNHGFAVKAEPVPDGVVLREINLNDQTVEGIDLPELNAFSLQYHPESSPGPHDAQYHFTRFFEGVVGYHGGGA